jgi:hypothetical protein
MNQFNKANSEILLEDSALNRIISAVGELPREPDRDGLRQDLLECYGRYSILSAPGVSGFNAEQMKRLGDIRTQAKKLEILLKADDKSLRIIRKNWPIDDVRPAHLLPQISFLIEILDQMTYLKTKPGEFAKRVKARHAVTASAMQWLVGTALPQIFVNRFGTAVKLRRNQDRVLVGPYIDFCMQVLIEGGIETCSPETIAAALRGSQNAAELD